MKFRASRIVIACSKLCGLETDNCQIVDCEMILKQPVVGAYKAEVGTLNFGGFQAGAYEIASRDQGRTEETQAWQVWEVEIRGNGQG